VSAGEKVIGLLKKNRGTALGALAFDLPGGRHLSSKKKKYPGFLIHFFSAVIAITGIREVFLSALGAFFCFLLPGRGLPAPRAEPGCRRQVLAAR
jgi:hypothetical protein